MIGDRWGVSESETLRSYPCDDFVAGCNYEPVSVWEQYASDVRGTALPTGHFLPEEAPDMVSAALRDFLS
jgi:hypothetical protein